MMTMMNKKGGKVSGGSAPGGKGSAFNTPVIKKGSK